MLAVTLPTMNLTEFRVKLANEVTFKRMSDTMIRLRDSTVTDLSSLADILLGRSDPSPVQKLADVKFIDETLNDSQKDAVRFCLSAPEIALIHGPPGV
jgi:DNA polymerase alpha-associated DNA helicase A